jgi:hypothetical protein
MVAIRNLSQHRSVPLHQLTISHTRVETADRRSLVTVTPGMRLADLRRDAEFKRSVLLELERLGQHMVDARPLLRDYLAGLADCGAIDAGPR